MMIGLLLMAQKIGKQITIFQDLVFSSACQRPRPKWPAPQCIIRGKDLLCCLSTFLFLVRACIYPEVNVAGKDIYSHFCLKYVVSTRLSSILMLLISRVAKLVGDIFEDAVSGKGVYHCCTNNVTSIPSRQLSVASSIDPTTTQ
jgi:hypothetical protein